MVTPMPCSLNDAFSGTPAFLRRSEMKKILLPFFALLVLCLSACATSGQKYVSIDYTGDVPKTGQGAVGVSLFQDNRKNFPGGYIGHRLLLDNSQETYFVTGMNLAGTLTQTTASFLEKKGYTTQDAADWQTTPDGVADAPEQVQYLLTGTIDTFECRAKKRGGHTRMVLDIHLTLYLGVKNGPALRTIPVSYSLEKTEMTFTRKKLERFVNESIAEIFEKALIIKE